MMGKHCYVLQYLSHQPGPAEDFAALRKNKFCRTSITAYSPTGYSFSLYQTYKIMLKETELGVFLFEKQYRH